MGTNAKNFGRDVVNIVEPMKRIKDKVKLEGIDLGPTHECAKNVARLDAFGRGVPWSKGRTKVRTSSLRSAMVWTLMQTIGYSTVVRADIWSIIPVCHQPDLVQG